MYKMIFRSDFVNKDVMVRDFAEASATHRELIEGSGMGASNVWPTYLYSREKPGKPVAHVSYNGKVWVEGVNPGEPRLDKKYNLNLLAYSPRDGYVNNDLRSATIRLAYENDDLRGPLLDILNQHDRVIASQKKQSFLKSLEKLSPGLAIGKSGVGNRTFVVLNLASSPQNKGMNLALSGFWFFPTTPGFAEILQFLKRNPRLPFQTLYQKTYKIISDTLVSVNPGSTEEDFDPEEWWLKRGNIILTHSQYDSLVN